MNKLINSTTGNSNAQQIAQGANTGKAAGLGNMVTTNIVSNFSDEVAISADGATIIG